MLQAGVEGRSVRSGDLGILSTVPYRNNSWFLVGIVFWNLAWSLLFSAMVLSGIIGDAGGIYQRLGMEFCSMEFFSFLFWRV